MKSRTGKRLMNLLVVALLFAAIGFVDWGHFFPVSAHSDLGFQVVGECIEVMVVLGVFSIAYFGFAKERRKNSHVQVSDGKRVVGGAVFAALMIFLNWRAFFPGDRFNFEAGFGDLIGAVFAGALMGLLVVSNKRSTQKPSSEEEKSVV